jgi:hypothetical protein
VVVLPLPPFWLRIATVCIGSSGWAGSPEPADDAQPG